MSVSPAWTIGLMSGTSLDGVDAALIRTDGETVVERGPWLTLHYEAAFQQRLRESLKHTGNTGEIERELTLRHAEAVEQLLQHSGMRREDIRVVGFHGQTIVHRPWEGITRQIGDGALLASRIGIDVVNDFRSADVKAGGQGAPLVPLYHAALAHDLPKPIAIVNIGGVANVTWIGEGSMEFGVWSLGNETKLQIPNSILAFDTGPGCALINDAVHRATSGTHDEDGRLARAGKVDVTLVAEWLCDPYFTLPPPKSLDRNHFAELTHQGDIATLTYFTAASIRAAQAHFPEAPSAWYICGGGRHNPVIMETLRDMLGDVHPVEALGWEGDALEAQAFAYLAVRSLKGLPLSLPSTTGVKEPVTGGVLHKMSS